MEIGEMKLSTQEAVERVRVLKLIVANPLSGELARKLASDELRVVWGEPCPPRL